MKNGANVDLGYTIFIKPPARALNTKLLDITSERNKELSERSRDEAFIAISGAFKNSIKSVAPAVCSGKFKVFISDVMLGTKLNIKFFQIYKENSIISCTYKAWLIDIIQVIQIKEIKTKPK